MVAGLLRREESKVAQEALAVNAVASGLIGSTTRTKQSYYSATQNWHAGFWMNPALTDGLLTTRLLTKRPVKNGHPREGNMQEHYYRFWRDMIKPKGFEIDKDSLREDYARFIVRPFGTWLWRYSWKLTS